MDDTQANLDAEHGLATLDIELRTASEPHSLGQPSGAQNLPLLVSAYVGHSREPIQQAKRMKDGGIDTHSNGGIALLDALEGSASGERTICYNHHSQLAAATRVMNVGTELSKHSAHGRWSGMRSRHMYASYDFKCA